MGWIGSAVWPVATKWLPGFSFFQLSWVPNIYLMLNDKSIETHACAFLTLNIQSKGTVLPLLKNIEADMVVKRTYT